MNTPITVNHRNGNTLFYFEQLSSVSLLDSFSCLIAEYNDYLFNDALRSQNDHIALTWLLRERTTDAITAYMSLITDAIKLSVSEREIHNLNYPFKTIPAMKIAKLAFYFTPVMGYSPTARTTLSPWTRIFPVKTSYATGRFPCRKCLTN
ncbi:hypothetical protein R84B8_02037 [Treponema sp. R8-4-B8]